VQIIRTVYSAETQAQSAAERQRGGMELVSAALTLACLETLLRLVDHVDAALAADEPVVAVTAAQ
jgi:hypothetical protein